MRRAQYTEEGSVIPQFIRGSHWVSHRASPKPLLRVFILRQSETRGLCFRKIIDGARVSEK